MNSRTFLLATVLAVTTLVATAQKVSVVTQEASEPESKKFTPTVLAASLSAETAANTDLARLSIEIARVERAIIDNGCDTNLCFSLQGGSDVTDAEFEEQQNFIDLVIQIVTTDEPANYAGVQYASRPNAISELDGNRRLFLERLHRAERIPGGTNIASGIRWCGKQMRPQRGDFNKMVVLGNGFATVGRDQVRASRRFNQEGGHICAITVGPSDVEALTEITGTPDRILGLDGFFELSEIIVDLVQQVCRLPPL